MRRILTYSTALALVALAATVGSASAQQGTEKASATAKIAAAAVDPAAESLLVKSVGGEAGLASIRHMTSYEAYGSADLNGLKGTYRELFLPPDKLYMEIRAAGLDLVQAYDGRTAWQRDQNGRISKLSGYERREMLKSVYLESFSFVLPGRIQGGIELLADTTVADTSYRRVALYPMRRDTILMLINPHTGRRKYLISRLDNFLARTENSDWHMIDSIPVPFVQMTSVTGAPLAMSFVTDSVRLNRPIDPNIFGMPGQGGADYRFGGTEKAVTIPFVYVRGHIWIKAAVNGRAAAWFLLDSGASANLLNKATVGSLNLPESGTMPAMGFAGFENVALVKTDSITIGQLVLLNQVAGMLDLTPLHLHPGLGRTVGGILGHDFLSRFPILVNFKDSTLTVFNPDGFTPPEGGVNVPFHLTMLVPTVHATLDSIPGDYLVDLGNAYGLVLHRHFADTHDLNSVLRDTASYSEDIGGIGGATSSETGVVPRFRIGDILLSDLPVMIASSEQGLAGSEELAGNIGNMILERFGVLFDYADARLIFYKPDR